ncbi:calcium uptake protein 2, mitochondrial [Seriola lalandi dorsalis]|uniref:Mitochondrial calcium uptake 2 n=1 Tax=Seriola lalandi dorsalis TaxID=1841481 RepID=A0A3B4WUF0_SERLL|nr:calcium uptake protein 2, mitochondrial [Seriola lalandi dorsalis]XP_056252533.1 calcium uptake protein 2, mitochondrial [Seriola aureovittata]
MASWGKVAAVLRNVLRSPRALRSLALRRVVGPGVVGSVIGTGLFCYYRYHANNRTLPFAVHAEEQREAPAPQLSARKRRFIKFASMVYEQEPYMTPRDFLFSVMLENVDRKLQKRILTTEDVNRMLASASKARSGNDLFRTLGDQGLISYTEYLFLLTILTKPRTGFHIAFKMLDVDGNEQVDKKEFLKLKKIIGKSKMRIPKDSTEKPEEKGEGVNTTLQAYFFGSKGENKLQYQEFQRFMEDLQAEVQEMEFLQFSKGMDTMRREDFAEWLLHYTNEEDNEVYWENMRKRIPAGQSITFDEFKVFCLFTNNLEDFAFSMKMVTGANRPVGMAQFKRAVKIATGHDLSENVLDTVFKLFDMDGDNCLSHKEFIGVMKDRVLRGLKVQPQNGFSGYWKCVKQETLKGAQEALGDNGCPI